VRDLITGELTAYVARPPHSHGGASAYRTTDERVICEGMMAIALETGIATRQNGSVQFHPTPIFRPAFC
jgi:succinate dehydrogenase/fumarate reductase flavoprotein subunit